MIYFFSITAIVIYLKEIHSFCIPHTSKAAFPRQNHNIHHSYNVISSRYIISSLPSSSSSAQKSIIKSIRKASISSQDVGKTSATAATTTITIPQHYPHPSTPSNEVNYPSPLHKIHIQQLLSKEEASQCLSIAKSHAQQTNCWTQKDSDRHASYATADFPIDECDELETYLQDELEFEKRIYNWIHCEYDIDESQLSFLDLFCAHYQGENDGGVMDRLEQHRDGSLLSFTIVLSESESYVGGGTIFDALRDVEPSKYPEYNGYLLPNGVVRVQNPGEAVLHSGKAKHGGNVVTQGERTVIVGFVDVSSTCMRDGVLKEACKEWGRSDVAKNRSRRQMKTAISAGKNGWNIKELKFMNGNHIGGYVPVFDSVKRRGGEEYQRIRNLQTEDILLRDILLPRSERITSKFAAQFGDDEITIL